MDKWKESTIRKTRQFLKGDRRLCRWIYGKIRARFLISSYENESFFKAEKENCSRHLKETSEGSTQEGCVDCQIDVLLDIIVKRPDGYAAYVQASYNELNNTFILDLFKALFAPVLEYLGKENNMPKLLEIVERGWIGKIDLWHHIKEHFRPILSKEENDWYNFLVTLEYYDWKMPDPSAVDFISSDRNFPENWKSYYIKKAIPYGSDLRNFRHVIFDKVNKRIDISHEDKKRWLELDNRILMLDPCHPSERSDYETAINDQISLFVDIVVKESNGYAACVEALFHTSLHDAFFLLCKGFLGCLSTKKDGIYAKLMMRDLTTGVIKKCNLWKSLDPDIKLTAEKENDWYNLIVNLEAQGWEIPFSKYFETNCEENCIENLANNWTLGRSDGDYSDFPIDILIKRLELSNEESVYWGEFADKCKNGPTFLPFIPPDSHNQYYSRQGLGGFYRPRYIRRPGRGGFQRHEGFNLHHVLPTTPGHNKKVYMDEQWRDLIHINHNTDVYPALVDAVFNTNNKEAFGYLCKPWLQYLATKKSNLFAEIVLKCLIAGTVSKENLWNVLAGYFSSIMTKKVNDWYSFFVNLKDHDWDIPFSEDAVSVCLDFDTSENWKTDSIMKAIEDNIHMCNFMTVIHTKPEKEIDLSTGENLVRDHAPTDICPNIQNILVDIFNRAYPYAACVEASFYTHPDNLFLRLCTSFLQFLATNRKILFARYVLICMNNGAVTKENLWVILKRYFSLFMEEDNDWYNFLVKLEDNDWEMPNAVDNSGVEYTAADGKKYRQFKDSEIYISSVIIGKGGSSTVYRGIHLSLKSNFETQRPAAIKKYICKSDDAKYFDEELKIWAKLTKSAEKGNANILRFYAASLHQTKEFMEYCIAMELGIADLEKEIKQLKTTNGSDGDPEHYHLRVGYLRDILEAIMYLHSRTPAFVHRDIKPANIFIFPTSGNDLSPSPKSLTKLAKLGDFGCSRVASETRKTYAAGTQYFMPPECQTTELIANQTSQDVYSFGATCYFVMSMGEYISNHNMGHNDATNYQPTLEASENLISAKHIIDEMTKEAPLERPNIQNVRKHPFFYTPEEQLSFVETFASSYLGICVDEKDKNRKIDVKLMKNVKTEKQANQELKNKIQTKIDNAFSQVVKNFDWVKRIGIETYNDIIKRTSSTSKNSYNKKSVISLTILIRDKKAHITELVNNLTIFRKEDKGNSVVCKRKYISFFVEKVPELLPYLHSVVQNPEYEGYFKNVLPNI